MSNELQILIDTASKIRTSSIIPQHLRQEGELLTAMMFIRELGLPLISGLQNISVIQGKPTLNSHLLWALVMKQPDLKKIEVKSDDSRATVRITRSLGEFEATFSMEDARKAQLVKPNSNWEKYPKNMMEARAKSNCARLAYPEALFGIMSSEEMRDLQPFQDSPKEPQEVPATVSNNMENDQAKYMDKVSEYVDRVTTLQKNLELTSEEAESWTESFYACGDVECLRNKGLELKEFLEKKKEQAKEFGNALNLQIPENQPRIDATARWDES